MMAVMVGAHEDTVEWFLKTGLDVNAKSAVRELSLERVSPRLTVCKVWKACDSLRLQASSG